MSTQDPLEGYSKTKWWFWKPSQQPQFTAEMMQPAPVPDFINSKVYCFQCGIVHERGKHTIENNPPALPT